MKAMTRRPRALLYLPAGQDPRPVQALLEAQGIAVRLLAAEELGATMGTLAAGGRGAPAVSPAVPEGFLVLCDVPSHRLDRLLAALRAAGRGGLLKAALTAQNAAWPAERLYDELCRERAAMQGQP